MHTERKGQPFLSPEQFTCLVPCHLLSGQEAGRGFRLLRGWLAGEGAVWACRGNGHALVVWCKGRCGHHACGYAAAHRFLNGLRAQHN